MEIFTLQQRKKKRTPILPLITVNFLKTLTNHRPSHIHPKPEMKKKVPHKKNIARTEETPSHAHIPSHQIRNVFNQNYRSGRPRCPPTRRNFGNAMDGVDHHRNAKDTNKLVHRQR